MKIGIIVYSQTGNTYSVAQKLKEKLTVAGHAAEIERVTPVGEVHPGVKSLQFEKLSDVEVYDALVFAAPVQGFALSPVMNIYLTGLSSLRDKKIACFVTMFFPFSWMGGYNAIGQMKRICVSKDAKVIETGIVNWSSKRREEMITGLVEKLDGLF